MDWTPTLIGAAISFASSAGILFVQNLIHKIGKLNIYCVVCRGNKQLDSVGFYTSNSNPGIISFVFPIKLEILNTSNIPRIIRDVSLWLYLNGKSVAQAEEIHTISSSQFPIAQKTVLENYGGDKNMYSFVAQPKSIQREHCLFIAKAPKDDIEKYSFDEVCLSYFDEHDRKNVFLVRKIEHPWKIGVLPADNDWILLKHRRK